MEQTTLEFKPESDAPTTPPAVESSLPPPPPPGLNAISGYRDTTRVTRILQVLLGTSILVSGVSAASSLWAARLFSAIINDPLSVSVAEVDSVNDREALMGILQPVMLILVGVGFILWTSRCYRNLRSLGCVGLRFTEGWAIGAWLIPFLNLVRPKQIVDDIWRGSDPDLAVARPPATVTDWRHRPVWGLLHWWWAAYVLIAVVGMIATINGVYSPSSFADSRNAAIWLTVAEIIEVVAGILAFIVVTTTSLRLEARASQIRGDGAQQPFENLTSWREAHWVPLVLVTAVSLLVIVVGPQVFQQLDDPGEVQGGGAEGLTDARGEGVLISDLEPGDCANLPADLAADPLDITPILAVEVLSCAVLHDLEVFASETYPDPIGADYPGDDVTTLEGIRLCAGHFDSYVGEGWLLSGLDIFLIQPQEQSWRYGDRDLVCMARSLGASRLEQSVADSGGILVEGQRSPWGLEAGECFNDPTGIGQLVVEVHDCRRPHDNQVYAIVEHPGAESMPYPGDGTMSAFVSQECAQAFNATIDPAAEGDLDFGAFAWPFAIAWDSGDRRIVCTLWSRDLSKLQDSALAGA